MDFILNRGGFNNSELINNFVESKTQFTRLDIENHVSGNAMYDTIVKTNWSAMLNNGVNHGTSAEVDIVNKDGKMCIDLSDNAISLSTTSQILGENYTCFYIWYPRDYSGDWVRLHAYESYIPLLIQSTTNKFGYYNSSLATLFTTNDITIVYEWQVVIVVADGTTIKYYRNDKANNNALLLIDSLDGNIGNNIDLNGLMLGGKFSDTNKQQPGWLIEAGILKETLDISDLSYFMKLLVNKMEH